MTPRRYDSFQIFLLVSLIVGLIVLMFPVVWTFSASFRDDGHFYQIPWRPFSPPFLPTNYLESWSWIAIPFRNGLVFAGTCTLSSLFLSSLAGFALARYDFPGRAVIFYGILATMMIPFSLVAISMYGVVIRLGWVDTYQGLALPFLMSGLGVFLMRQFFLEFPGELLDQGRIDGCSEFGLFIRIAAPVSRPALATLAVITFLGCWEEFTWPLIVAPQHVKTLPIALTGFVLQYVSKMPLLAAATIEAIIPMMLVFLVFQKWIIKGIAFTGLNG